MREFRVSASKEKVSTIGQAAFNRIGNLHVRGATELKVDRTCADDVIV